MTTPDSLTERYMAAVLRNIPGGKRADVERELRSSIADAIDDRTQAGESTEQSERSALEAMGDPALLAGSLTGRVNYLIGPAIFPRYRDMLLLLIASLAPLIGVVLGLLEFGRTADIGKAIAAGITSVLNFIVYTVFWLTVVFAAIERTDVVARLESQGTSKSDRWSVDQLPHVPTNAATIGDTFEGILTAGIAIVALIVLPHVTWTTDAGQVVPLLEPSLGDFWIPLLLGLVIVELGFHLFAYVRGRWTLPMAALYAIPQIAVAGSLVYLALNGLIINPAFSKAIDFPQLGQAGSPGMLIFAGAVVIVAAIEIFKTFRRAAAEGRPQSEVASIA